MTEPDDLSLKLPRPPSEDVFTATEGVRAADFPDVPAELLVAVLTAEQSHPDNRIAAARAVAREIDTWLAARHDEPVPDIAAPGGEVTP